MKEPQSYGSDRDWTTGKTGQEVNDQDAAPAPEHRQFYDESRESEENVGAQGGMTSGVQLAENDRPGGRTTGEHSPISGVTTTRGGAKRGGYFKKRDYE